MDQNSVGGYSAITQALPPLPPAATAYAELIEKLRRSGTVEVIRTLQKLECIYRAFPEFESDYAKEQILERLHSAFKTASDHEVFSLLNYVISLKSPNKVFFDCANDFLARNNTLTWIPLSFYTDLELCNSVIDRISCLFLNHSINKHKLVSTLSEMIELADLDKEVIANRFRDILSFLLRADQSSESSRFVSLEVALSLKRRLGLRRPRKTQEVPQRLLDMALRLRGAPPLPQPKAHLDRAWPSGPMSFDEFLLQWPCEIELPTDGSDERFICETYQALLLREASRSEIEQYCKLLSDDDGRRHSIIEDIMISEEFLSLQWRVRINQGAYVIADPEAQNMITVALFRTLI